MAEVESPYPRPSVSKHLSELPVLLALFLDLTAFGMVFPDVQLHARDLGGTGPIIGLLLASMFLIQFIASPPWGILSDRIGRRPVFLICTILSVASWLVYAASNSLELILVSRVLAGVAAANVVVAQAYLADITPEERRGVVMGRAGAAISGGLILGPAIGMQISARAGTASLGYAAAACSFLAVLCGLMMAAPGERKERQPGKNPVINLSLLRDYPALRPLVFLAVGSWFALATLEGTFGRLITEHYHLPKTVFGDIFSMESLVGALVQGVVLAWLARLLTDRAILRIGFFLVGVGLMLTPFAPNVVLLFLFSALYSIGTGLANPTVNSSASTMVAQDRQGELFGLLQGTRSVGFLVGPALGGALFDWRPESPYVLAGAVGLIAAMLVPRPKAASAAEK